MTGEGVHGGVEVVFVEVFVGWEVAGCGEQGALGGVFSWVVAPSVLAGLLVPDLFGQIAAAPRSSLMWSYLFGVLWGIGGLTFGLTMRYLGIALGMAVALGFCAAFGTLMPPIFDGKFGGLLATSSGLTVLAGVLACLVGIGISGAAGMSKERELSQEEKAAAIKEFDFKKGMLVAVFAGVMIPSLQDNPTAKFSQ